MREWLWNQRKAATGSTPSGQKVKPPFLLDNCAGLCFGWLEKPNQSGSDPRVLSTTSLSSVQFSCSVVSTLCDPMNRSTPGLPVHHHLPEFTQTHVHQVGDAIQPSHPLSSVPFSSCLQSFPASGFFQWVSSLHQVARVLEFQLQHQSFQWTPRTDLLQDGLVGFPHGSRDSQESFPTPQFKSINSSAPSFLYSKAEAFLNFQFLSSVPSAWIPYPRVERAPRACCVCALHTSQGRTCRTSENTVSSSVHLIRPSVWTSLLGGMAPHLHFVCVPSFLYISST